MEFLRWWVLKCKIFAQESTCSKKLKQSYDELRFVKKCQNHTFKVNFLCQKSTEFFQKKNHLRISIKATIFCKKHFFLTSIFEPLYFPSISYYFHIPKNFLILFLISIFKPLYFLKSCPIFDEVVLPVFSKYNGLLWVYWLLIFGQKSCFLGPTIFKIPQPNWY